MMIYDDMNGNILMIFDGVKLNRLNRKNRLVLMTLLHSLSYLLY